MANSAAKPNPSRPREFQKQQVYLWEEKEFDNSYLATKLNRFGVRMVISTIMSTYNVPFQALIFKEGKESIAVSFHTIYLTPYGQSAYIVIHEAAHCIQQWMVSNKLINEESAHGPVWLSIYLHLLATCLDVDINVLINSAKPFKLRYQDLNITASLLQTLKSKTLHHNCFSIIES